MHRRNGDIIKKPAAVDDHNRGKVFIDRSDQMASYSFRLSLKWHRKIVFDILLSTSVVNACFIYKSITKNSITITKFKEEIAKSLFCFRNVSIPITTTSHKLVSSDNLKKRKNVSKMLFKTI